MSTEAPVAPSPMSEERKRKMAEGRARALAEKKAKKEKREARAAAKAAAKAAQEIGVKVEAVNAPAVFEGPRAEILAPAPVASASPDLSAQIAEMRAQIDALKGIKASIPAAEATPAEPALKTTRKPEAWYEYKQKDGWKATAALGLNRIDDPEDERWDGELSQAPFKGDAGGALVCAIVTRVDGEIVKKDPICGGPCHKNKAQEFLRQFKRLEAEGSKTPWDQERYYRDKKAEMEEALQKGQIEQLKLLREVWQQTLRDKPATAEEARS